MNRDWVVWIGCVMLFFSGVVWGGLTIDSKFLKIDSLHDLFEIAGAIATCAAVYIAATWKRQLGSTKDYELARSFSILTLRYKESIVALWEVAENCVVQIEQGDVLSEPVRTAVSLSFKSRVASAESLRREIQELIDESRAIWRNNIEQDFATIIAFESNCSSCVKTYISVIEHLVQGGAAVAMRYSIRKYRDYFNDLGLKSTTEAQEYVEQMFDPVALKLDSIMK